MKYGPKYEGFLYSFSKVLNPKDNGGEAITLGVDVYKDDNTLYLETQCYGVHKSRISLPGVTLDQLETAIQSLKSELDTTKFLEDAAAEVREKAK